MYLLLTIPSPFWPREHGSSNCETESHGPALLMERRLALCRQGQSVVISCSEWSCWRLKARAASSNTVPVNMDIQCPENYLKSLLSHGVLAHQSRHFLVHAEEVELCSLLHSCMKVHCKGFSLLVSMFCIHVLLTGSEKCLNKNWGILGK